MADLSKEIFDLVDVQPYRKMQVMEISRLICEQFPEHHAGEVRRAIRMLVDEGRATLQSGNFLVIN
jgi:hypothetical protein